jgi:hypothetical protein
MSLSISEWFGGDGGDEPRKVRSDGADLTIAERLGQEGVPPPVPPARALPVTPAERFCVTVLRAYLAWNSDGDPDEPASKAASAMLRVTNLLADVGLVSWSDGSLSDVGHDLLARVEAEPAPLPPVPILSDDAAKSPIAALLWFADEGHYEGTYRKGAGFAEACGLSIARKALGLPVDRPDNTLMPLSEALAGRTRVDAVVRHRQGERRKAHQTRQG